MPFRLVPGKRVEKRKCQRPVLLDSFAKTPSGAAFVQAVAQGLPGMKICLRSQPAQVQVKRDLKIPFGPEIGWIQLAWMRWALGQRCRLVLDPSAQHHAGVDPDIGTPVVLSVRSNGFRVIGGEYRIGLIYREALLSYCFVIIKNLYLLSGNATHNVSGHSSSVWFAGFGGRPSRSSSPSHQNISVKLR